MQHIHVNYFCYDELLNLLPKVSTKDIDTYI